MRPQRYSSFILALALAAAYDGKGAMLTLVPVTRLCTLWEYYALSKNIDSDVAFMFVVLRDADPGHVNGGTFVFEAARRDGMALLEMAN